MSTRTVIAFDLDDTLYNEREYMCQALSRVANYYAPLSEYDDRRLLQFMLAAPNPFDALESRLPDGVASIHTFLDIYRNCALEPMPLRPDAARLLQCLHDVRSDIPLYIITDGDACRQRAKIRALGLDDYFDDRNILISSEAGEKLTGRPFDTVMQREGQDADTRFIYIGDNPAKDFVEANRRGWHTIMVADTGFNVHPQTITPPLPADHAPLETVTTLDSIIPRLCQ